MNDEIPGGSRRHVIEEAIEAWRDGETLDAVHPLPERPAWMYDPDVVKDLARVIDKRLP